MNECRKTAPATVRTHSVFFPRSVCVCDFFPLASQSRNPSITIKFSSLRVAFFSVFFFSLLLSHSLCFSPYSFLFFFLLFAAACLVCCVPKPLLNAGRNFQTSISIISDRPTYLSLTSVAFVCKSEFVKYMRRTTHFCVTQ